MTDSDKIPFRTLHHRGVCSILRFLLEYAPAWAIARDLGIAESTLYALAAPIAGMTGRSSRANPEPWIRNRVKELAYRIAESHGGAL